MAYQTGTSTDVNDLLDKFRLFAIAEGWTENRWVDAGAGKELCINKSDSYFNFRSFSDETMNINSDVDNNKYGIVLNGSDNYAALDAWDKQPGYPKSPGRISSVNGDQAHVLFPIVLNTGPFPTYHFFSPDAKTLYAEVEIVTATYIRFGCGALDLFNSAAAGGGRFCYATSGRQVTDSVASFAWLGADMDSSSNAVETVPFRLASLTYNRYSGSMVRAAFGSFDNWAGSGGSVDANLGLGMACQGGGVEDKVLRDYSPNPINEVGILLSNKVSLNISDHLSPIGTVPGMRYMDMTRYIPAEEFSLGSETYKVFPWYQKGGLGYNRGIAYLKNA